METGLSGEDMRNFHSLHYVGFSVLFEFFITITQSSHYLKKKLKYISKHRKKLVGAHIKVFRIVTSGG